MWPVFFWIASAAMRAAMSAVPPGAKPTMTWIGCLGTQSAARTAEAARIIGAASNDRRNILVIPQFLFAQGRARAVPGQCACATALSLSPYAVGPALTA